LVYFISTITITWAINCRKQKKAPKKKTTPKKRKAAAASSAPPQRVVRKLSEFID